MKIGLVPVNVGIESVTQMVGLAQAAEANGFESVWTFEHAIVPLDYTSKYPYSPTGKMGIEPDTNFVDPLIALSHIAAHTTELKMGTGVNIVPQANPLYVAKQAASLDFLSGQRFMFGVGMGWLQEEYVACGVPFEKRGARFDDYMAAMRKLWSGGEVDHQSEFINWQGFKSYPNAPTLPIVMGGNKGKTFARIAQYAQGWLAPTTKPEELEQEMKLLAAACDDAERDINDIEITCMWPAQGGQESIDALAAAGAHRLLIPLQALGADPLAGMQQIAQAHIK